MKALLVTCALLLSSGLVLDAAPALKGDGSANLLTNGSFENGPDIGAEGFKPIDKDSAAIKGWVVTRGQIDVTQETGENWKAADGKRSLDLHGSPGLGGVKQSFATKAGRKYRLTFQMSGNPGVGATEMRLAVLIGDTSKEFTVDMAGRSATDLKWEKKTWEFTAADKLTELEIHTAMPATSNAFGGPMLDDVRVVAID
jgi:choice-of-anchor C domain-containing protein